MHSSPPSATPPAPQTIFRFRREYNAWVADETREDYALRYTPRSFRRWSELRVANTAFGSLSFLALEAIGGAIALNYGFANAMWAILAVGLVIFLTGLPIAVCAARYGLDMDLLTRGAGFGYLGSTITSLIYAVFTFILFALEAAIMALALQLVVDWPLLWCYVLSALIIIPLAMRGITLISRLQAWTQPLWLFLLVLPFVWIALAQPQLYRDFSQLSGLRSGSSGFSPLMFGAAAAVIFALVVQIGEQVDFLRFLPPRTRANRLRWWGAVLVAGPGWIVMGMLKMAGGAFLAFAALQLEAVDATRAVEPTQMFLAGFRQVTQALGLPGLAVAVTVVFVVVSQIKINLTNAYAGSLAWSNFFARITRSHPGRVVWLVFNVVIATLLMGLGVFGALEKVLTIYSNVAIAWVGALVADLVINKPLGLSPPGIEFRRAHLYDFNPVGLGAMLLAAIVACCAYAGLLGEVAAAFSPFIALALSMLLSPLLAWATRGRYYIARPVQAGWRPGEMVQCAVCQKRFESEDMARCPAYGAPICSLCCTLESRCHDRCKSGSRAGEQLRALASALLPPRWATKVNFRIGQYLVVMLSLCAVMAFMVGVVYMQENLHAGAGDVAGLLRLPFLKVFALLALLCAVAAWWVVLSTDSRRMAQDESERQTQLLLQDRGPQAHRCRAAGRQGPCRAGQPGQDALRGRHDARVALAAQQHPGLHPDPAAQPRGGGCRARDPVDHAAQRPAPARADRRVAGTGQHRGRPPAPGPGAPAPARADRQHRGHDAPAGPGQGPAVRGRNPGQHAALGARRRQAAAPDPDQPAVQCRALHAARRGAAAHGLPAPCLAHRGHRHRHRHRAAGPGAYLRALRARQRGTARQRDRHGPGADHHPPADRTHGRAAHAAQHARRGQLLHRAAVPARDGSRRLVGGARRGCHAAQRHRLPGAPAHPARGGRPAPAAPAAGRPAAAAGFRDPRGGQRPRMPGNRGAGPARPGAAGHQHG
jgi:purine-cytosine permease-like protein